MKWLLAALAVLILWGAWGALLKVVSTKAEWHDVYLATNTAILIAMAGIALVYGYPSAAKYGARWLALAIATGFAGTIGYILLVLSLKWGGKASIVIPLTSLYPAVTVLITRFMLGETIGPKKAVGIGLALAAIVLLTSE